MRAEDLERMNEPYANFSDAFGRAIEARNEAVAALNDEIFGDLDEVNFGISWWRGYEPSLSHVPRVLISDHLVQSVASVGTNLVDAHLHLLEFVDARERMGARLKGIVKHDANGQPFVKSPPSLRAADDLPRHLAELHASGFFRSIGSIFDCLGAVTVGVLGLRTDILTRLTFPSVRRNALRVRTLHPLQRGFATTLEAAIAAGGPEGWLDWALAYRHMLVHRARRFQHELILPLQTISGYPITVKLEAEVVPLLCRDPARSDIEVLADRSQAPTLPENAEATLRGVLRCTHGVLTASADALREAWRTRRADPTLIEQPSQQWPNLPSHAPVQFDGFTVPKERAGWSPDTVYTSPSMLRRIRAASLADGAHVHWPAFGGTPAAGSGDE